MPKDVAKTKGGYIALRNDASDGKPGTSKQSRNSNNIESKLKEIKGQKPHFTNLAGCLTDLVTPVTPVTAKVMTNKTKNTEMNPADQNSDDDAEDQGDYGGAGKSAVAGAADADAEQKSTLFADTMAFVVQPDGSHKVLTSRDPVSEEEQNAPMREIIVGDGVLVILTGDNGEVVYRPDDSVIIDVEDSRVFVVGAQENDVTYIEDDDGTGMEE
ncbi:uncharacterized protein LOC113564594 [Drosophila erecta]|uniref:uncharacterized protein LOC113564594 n=1 Tax=Drosophila erecta TaxID=7220 RepID=UPI0001780F2D|nr:uncharacterized protein LOC113564594 [Drosophila erecta]